MALDAIFVQHADMIEVAELLIVVEAVTDHELVGQ